MAFHSDLVLCIQCDERLFSVGFFVQESFKLTPGSGLSLRAGARGFSPATKRVAPGYFYRKMEEK